MPDPILLTADEARGKCKRCSYLWLPCGTFESPKDGRLFMTDVGICQRCDHAKSRLRIATPGDQLNAMIWGQRFEARGMG